MPVTRTLQSAREELKAWLASKSEIDRKWLVTQVDSYGDGANRIELHVLEGSPDMGWVIVDHGRQAVHAFRHGRRVAHIDIAAGGRLNRTRR